MSIMSGPGLIIDTKVIDAKISSVAKICYLLYFFRKERLRLLEYIRSVSNHAYRADLGGYFRFRFVERATAMEI